MRYLALAVAVVFAAPLTADAQRASAARKLVEQQQRRAAPPPPGFHNQLYERVDRDKRDHRGRRDHRDADRWPQTRRPGWKGQSSRHRYPFGSYYAVPSYGYGYGYFGPAVEQTYDNARYTEPEIRQEAAITGTLRLEITPASALTYYVDGLYIGSSSDLGLQFTLNPGPRRVEVRAAGYKPLIFDTRIVAGNVTTFRAVLEPLTQPPPQQATGNPTMFIIPGCYMGNSRPAPNQLRPGCDISRMITR